MTIRREGWYSRNLAAFRLWTRQRVTFPWVCWKHIGASQNADSTHQCHTAVYSMVSMFRGLFHLSCAALPNCHCHLLIKALRGRPSIDKPNIRFSPLHRDCGTESLAAGPGSRSLQPAFAKAERIVEYCNIGSLVPASTCSSTRSPRVYCWKDALASRC